MEYPVGMLEDHKDRHWDEAQGSMYRTVKMRTDDQRDLHLGRPAQDRMRGLAGLVGTGRDTR